MRNRGSLRALGRGPTCIGKNMDPWRRDRVRGRNRFRTISKERLIDATVAAICIKMMKIVNTLVCIFKSPLWIVVFVLTRTSPSGSGRVSRRRRRCRRHRPHRCRRRRRRRRHHRHHHRLCCSRRHRRMHYRHHHRSMRCSRHCGRSRHLRRRCHRRLRLLTRRHLTQWRRCFRGRRHKQIFTSPLQ